MTEDSDAQDAGVPPAKRQRTDDGPPAETAPKETEEPAKEISASNITDDQYDDFVTPEEVEKLREFRVLDELKSNDEDSNDCDDSDSSMGESADLPEEEIEKMLEEDLPEDFKGAPKRKEKAYVTREKIILEEKGVNHFEVLPLDWIMIRHQSGMPVYVHRASRVCTLSKPYFLGKGNAKRHDIPISAIPCFAYRRALEEEERQKIIDQKVEEQIKSGVWNKEKTNQTNPQDQKSNSASADINVDKNVKPPNGTINIEALLSQCPFKRGSVANDTKGCPVLNKAKEFNEKPIEVSDEINETLPTTNQKKKDWESGVLNDDGLDDVSSENSQDLKELVGDRSLHSEISNATNDVDKELNGDVVKNEDISEKPTDSNADIEIPPNRQPIVLPGGIVMPSPRVETVNTSWKTQHLTHEQVNDYCKKLFKFRVLNIMHFKRWADRRKYTKARKALQYPMLPEGTKLITIPVQNNGQDNSGKATKRDWVMNMNGRSYLSVFHEYVRRALQKQPVYEFKQLENASTPYQATVYIGGMQYGVGHGSSKRQAKSAAARASIHILIPEMKEHLEPDSNEAEPDFVFFDYVNIEDPRIAEFCAATCEPTPHAILRTCLLRNFGAGDRHIHTEMKKLEYQKIELTMKVGKHSATVVCKNKKTAKQRASQAILQALHPHVRSWGSLLRLYGSRSVKSCKEKKLEEQQITLLQDKARHNEPNYAVLEKLRHEMDKLRERDAAVVPVGGLLLAQDLPTHSGSNLNNVEL